MTKSFQKEKPPARIDLFLEVDDGDASEKVELPLRMLMVGDYTGREEDTPVADREPIDINSNNFDDVMDSLDLELEYTVPNRLKGEEADEGEQLKVELEIDDMDSFSPEQVAQQVPEMNRMLAMRNLLEDLKNRVVSMSQFRRQLEEIVSDEEALGQLTTELQKFIPAESEA